MVTGGVAPLRFGEIPSEGRGAAVTRVGLSALTARIATLVVVGATATAAAAQGGDAPPAGRDLFGTRGGAEKPPPENAPVPATVTWSDGKKEMGKLSFTRGVPLTVYDLKKKEWVEIELADLAALEAFPRAEKMDREWRWKDYGNDEKVYTGRERPRRWLDHAVTLGGGDRMKVHVKGSVMYFDTVLAPEKKESPVGSGKSTRPAVPKKPEAKAEPKPVRRRLIIRQYDRGGWGERLEDLVYVKSIEVGEPDGAPKRARKPAGKRPGAE